MGAPNKIRQNEKKPDPFTFARDSLGDEKHDGFYIPTFVFFLGFGSIAAMVLLGLTTLPPTAQTLATSLRFTAFPLFMVGFLLLVASTNTLAQSLALAFIHCSFYYFSMILIIITVFAASKKSTSVVTIGSLLHGITYSGVAAGGITGNIISSFVQFYDLALSILASVCFLILFVAIFVFLQLKGDGTLWGIFDKKDLSEFQINLLKEKCARTAATYHLTTREEEIVFELSQGYNPIAISEHFTLSVQTVRTHISNIYKKTAVHSNADLLELVNKQSIEELDAPSE